MKYFKILFVLIVAAFLIIPATAQAKGPRFSFSINLYDAFVPSVVPPPRPVPVYVPYYPPHPICVEKQVIIKEYRYPHHIPPYPFYPY